jgi:hypothetical protein
LQGEAALYIQDKIKTKVVVAKLLGLKKNIRESTLKVLKDTLLRFNNLPLTSACFNCSITKSEINSVDLEELHQTLIFSLRICFDLYHKAFSSPHIVRSRTGDGLFYENINLDTINNLH